MTAREAKQACRTEGLVIYTEMDEGMLADHVISAVETRSNECVITVAARTWPLAVAAFNGWRAELLKTKGGK